MKILNYINGVLQAPVNNKYLDNTNPATGEIYGNIPRSDAEDVEAAVMAAKKAFPSWSALSAGQRSNWLLKIAQAIEDRMDELALAESVDNGKPLSLAKAVDIPRARDNFKFYATAVLHDAYETHDMGADGFNYTLRQPIGVAGCISPWNLPLYLFSWKIAPALASGNTVVAKPSEVTPATAYLLSEILRDIDFPKGVLNIVHGLGGEVGASIVEHPDTQVISFTGGTETGKAISKVAAPMFKKLSLELGGKNANVIFNDCDFDEAVKTSVRSSFSNQGQICLCGSRIYVQRGIYDKFKAAFLSRVAGLTVADPLSQTSRMGAIVSKDHFEKVLSYIELAREEGGTILAGGHAVKLEGRCENGYFIAPTVFENLPIGCRTNQEEIFGPVVTLTPFDTEEEALLLANGTVYGLASTVWTTNLQTAHRMAAGLHAGIIWVNCWLNRDLRTPFGGVKQSGVGREGGFEALRFFTEPKNICIKL
jgi:aminomuconate-semialdehyde/2-hydroxymuconate-6-semialdehyde dehydrogenase|tara:strand:+ start:1125 stop:2564 length:1440 start_codon:yes stop_codon:yes gene_type:complete